MKKQFFFCLWLFSASLGFAHPHVFIDATLTALMDENHFIGFQVKWTFDMMYSVSILEDLEIEMTDHFSKQQQQTIKTEAFDNVSNYNYFTDLSVNGQPQTITKIEHFKTYCEDEQLVYEFVIPLSITITENPIKLTISQYDPTYFVVVNFTGDIEYQTPTKIAISTQAYENEAKAFYYQQVVPLETILSLQRKAQ